MNREYQTVALRRNPLIYEYNILNQVIKMIFPDGYADTFTYDPYSNQLTKDSPEVQIRNTHDNLHRLISKTENIELY